MAVVWMARDWARHEAAFSNYSTLNLLLTSSSVGGRANYGPRHRLCRPKIVRGHAAPDSLIHLITVALYLFISKYLSPVLVNATTSDYLEPLLSIFGSPTGSYGTHTKAPAAFALLPSRSPHEINW